MKSRMVAFLVLVVLILAHARGQKEAEPVRFQKWTLDEVREQLRLYPRDAYLQYVAMILARQEGKTDEVANEIERGMAGNSPWPEGPDFGGGPAGRRDRVDLFSIFTGALAVQESLQLDTMRGDRRPPRWAPQIKSTPKPDYQTKPTDKKGNDFVPKGGVKDKAPVYKDRGPADKGPAFGNEKGKAPAYKDKGPPPERFGNQDKVPATKDKAPPPGRYQDKDKVPAYKDKGAPRQPGVQPVFEDPQEYVKRRRLELVSITDLSGPTIKSHPWEQMLGDKKPAISPLARCVPEDFYFVEFRSLTKMLEAMDISDLWGTHLFNQTVRDARTQNAGERVKNQLALETTPLLRPFYDLVVREVAVTGSDLFVREGSDVTVLFRFKQPEVFKARLDGFLAHAEKNNRGVEKSTGKILDVDYVHLATPDRELCVFSGYAEPDLLVRSNSKIAFQRVLEAIKGKTDSGKAVRRLGDTAEFAYIRTLMPRGAKEEDGFVYLSDPFIRRLVGPEVKLTERRRMICYNHLRMIAHAALLYRTEHGRRPESLEELAKAGCCPGPFNAGTLYCPEGGTYTLSADGTAGVCSRHGHAHFLTPCCEMPVVKVTGEEADEYQGFLREYNQYWRTFFDPIALRLQITPERYRLETIVLPLIDNSIYTGLATALGGKPEGLESLPIPPRNIFSVALRLNKGRLMHDVGLEEEKPIAEDDSKGARREALTAADRQSAQNLKVMGLAIHNYHDTYGRFPTAALLDKQKKKPLLSWRIGLLPFLEESNLYQQFHLDEPWDSEHNKKLIARMPKVFQGSNAELNKAGKTTVLAPIGKATLFSPDFQKLTFASVTDGTSNTILLVDAADDRAVVWTKPDDLNYDPKSPLAGLKVRHRALLFLFADGSIHFFKDTIAKEKLQALFTRNGNENIELDETDEPGFDQGIGAGNVGTLPEMLFLGAVGAENLQKFLSRGIGNQAALHVYDAPPMFDFNLPGFLGMTMGSFQPRRGRVGATELLPISFLIASLNAPVYLSVPVQDEKIVDEFLNRLDGAAAAFARHQERNFIPLAYDFYRFHPKLDKDVVIRSFGLAFGPVKLRFFWARISKGLYVASKSFILEDLVELQKTRATAEDRPGGSDPVAHAMVRIRAQNWKQVLADFRLGWAENNREACLANLGPLSSVARAFTASRDKVGKEEIAAISQKVHRFADHLHTAHFFCPEGGEYLLSPDGKTMTCSIHGSMQAPRQPPEPLSKSSVGQLLERFSGMTASLTFLDDGLHAVVTIERKTVKVNQGLKMLGD